MKHLMMTIYCEGKLLLLDKVRVADSFGSRLRGLMFYRVFPADCRGLLIYPCRSIHTFWMRFPLDVAILNRDGTIIQLWDELPPNRICPGLREAYYVLETPAGTHTRLGLKVGDRMKIVDS